ncbi:MAG: dipeptide/oligopeptide/nickel ABC transporter permease/ATP-binding protein [Actinomycetales bacterium]
MNDRDPLKSGSGVASSPDDLHVVTTDDGSVLTASSPEKTELPPPADPGKDSLWRAVWANPLGRLASILLVVIILGSLIGPWLLPNDPTRVDLFRILAPPGDGYLLGGDRVGRDVFARLVAAGSNTLLGALLAVSVATVIGATAGLIAGYYGKAFDAVASWAANILLALPAMVILLALYQALGSSVYTSMVVFGVILSPGFYRLVRNQVIAVKNELYVDAAKVSGLRDWRIITRHILGVVRSPLIIQISIVAGVAIIIQAGLEFLGLGDPGTPTWGGMLRDSFDTLYDAPLLILWPGLVISLTVMSLVLFANAVRDALRRQRSRPEAEPQKEADDSVLVDVTNSPTGPTDALLQVRNLRVGYGSDENPKVVVDGVSFDVRAGEVLGLVGESGSGKSQTTFAIMDLLPKGGRILGGSVTFGGRELTEAGQSEMSSIRGHEIAYVPQEPMSNLDPTFTVGHQLVEPMRAVLGISAADAADRALELLAKVGIRDPRRTFDAYPHEISGGMAQRVLIAGAIACDPVLLIADEPTTALDVTVQADILDLLRELQESLDMAMILVTHDFGVVADICDRVAVMQTGRIVEANDAVALFGNPRHPYTQMLLDSTMDDAPARGPLVRTGG